jgi:hypothetical protein
MGQTVRFQDTLRRLAMIDEGFVDDEAGLGLGPAEKSALDPKIAALLQVGRRWPGVAGDLPGVERRAGAGGGRRPGTVADAG